MSHVVLLRCEAFFQFFARELFGIGGFVGGHVDSDVVAVVVKETSDGIFSCRLSKYSARAC